MVSLWRNRLTAIALWKVLEEVTDARRERRGTAAVVARRRAVYIAIAEVSEKGCDGLVSGFSVLGTLVLY